MLLNCGVGEDSWESLGLQGDPTSPSLRKSFLNIPWKDWCWSWNSKTWPLDSKSWVIKKDPDAGKDWSQEKAMTEEDMIGWHHWLNEHESEPAPGDGKGQENLACYSPWDGEETDTNELLKNNNWTSPKKQDENGKHICITIVRQRRTNIWSHWPFRYLTSYCVSISFPFH